MSPHESPLIENAGELDGDGALPQSGSGVGGIKYIDVDTILAERVGPLGVGSRCLAVHPQIVMNSGQGSTIF